MAAAVLWVRRHQNIHMTDSCPLLHACHFEKPQHLAEEGLACSASGILIVYYST